MRRYRLTSKLATAVLTLLVLHASGGTGSAATALPPDSNVYGEQPATFRDDVTPFPPSGSIFQYQQDGNDPVTRLKFTAIPNLENGLGRFTWRLATFGKYVIMGNGQTNSIGGVSTDLRVGVFDSEKKQFCNLIVDAQLKSSVTQLVTGNPGARQSRILLAPGTTNDVGIAGNDAFGYIAADLGSANPCSWPVVMASAAQLNAGFPAGSQLCPGNLCIFDSVALLAHETVAGDPFGRDYVMLGEYFGGHNAVVRVDSTGIAVVATYKAPMFATPGSGGACYSGGAARLPSTDFTLPDTRNPNDWRFLTSFDAFRIEIYSSTPPAACAPPYPFCPIDTAPDGYHGAACPSGGSCAQRYCALAAVACSADNDCKNYLGTPFDVGPCTTACLSKSSLFTCKTANGGGSHRQCTTLRQDNCPIAGETCSPGDAAPTSVGPSQEFRFNKSTNTITPTSPMFFSATSNGALVGASPTNPVYDTNRSLWALGTGTSIGIYRTKTSTDNCTVDGATVHVAAGEHCYYNPSNPSTATVVTPDQTLQFEATPAIPYAATTTQIGTQTFVADGGSLQYAQYYNGAWFPVADTTYKVGFAFLPPYLPITDPLAHSTLPAEPRRCSISLLGCNTDADCLPSGGTCLHLAEDGVPFTPIVKFLQAGGSPTSLWVATGYKPTKDAPKVVQSDTFLERVPVGTNLPDNISTLRPSVAWDGNRLWLVAEHGGVLMYRVRDGGVWSGWYPVANPGDPVTPSGGVAIIASEQQQDLLIVAHNAAGTIYEKDLTVAAGHLTCAPGSCQWSNWIALPAGATHDDIAATYAGILPVVAVHGTDDGVYATVRGLGWVPWFRVSGVTTDAAPSVAYHPVDERVWIAARVKATTQVKYSRLNAYTLLSDPWLSLPTSGAPAAGTGPAVASDGSTVRVFVPQSAFPNFTLETANDGSGWSNWRQIPSSGGATRQPAAADVNGDINLITYWFTTGMSEAVVP